MKYNIELTEKQMRVVMIALEEYFRLRLGQTFDFSTDLASMGIDLSPDNPNHDAVFDRYIARRNHMQELMSAFYKIAYEPTGYLKEKTDDMMVAECIWDAIQFALGLSRWERPFIIGGEPSPKIEQEGDADESM